MSQLIEYIKMALDNIKSNKGRSVLTMLGIIIGISSVIMIMAIGAGAKTQMGDELAGIAGGQIVFYMNESVAEYTDYFTQDDMDAIKEKVEGVKGVTPTVYSWGTTETVKGNFELSIDCGTEDYEYMKKYPIVRGSYYTREDFEAGRRVCVIDKNNAIRMFGTDDVVGKTIDVTNGSVTREVRIVGIRGVDEESNIFSDMFYYSGGAIEMEMPYNTLRDFDIYLDDYYYSFYVLAEDDADSKQISNDVMRFLEARHQNFGEEMYLIEDFNDVMGEINSVLNLMTVFISFVAAISLLVGGIGVMNIMLVSVTERTREIGIRKALGAKTKSILIQFLLESSFITAIGGVIGIVLGIGGAYLICSLPVLGISPGIKVSTIILTTLFSSFVGIFFGIYPAKKAAKLSPIEALRRN